MIYKAIVILVVLAMVTFAGTVAASLTNSPNILLRMFAGYCIGYTIVSLAGDLGFYKWAAYMWLEAEDAENRS